ncbi:MAG: polyprenyl synthetase family protein, partial [Paludibacteraceae bacterium]|nr:polyprenyl synthetase family protein [Paludibacteraceae bacterium]
LLISALENADAESKAELLQWIMTTDRNEEKIAAVTAIYNRLGVRQICEAIMEEHTSLALAQLDKLPQNDSTERLRVMAEQLAMRKS